MYNAQVSSTASSRQSHIKGIAMVILALAAGSAVGLWLIAWSLGWKSPSLISWSVEPSAQFAPSPVHRDGNAMPQPRVGLVATNENRGQVLFGRYCDSCHPGGKAAAGPGLRDPKFAARYGNPAQLIGVIRKGGFEMPAFAPTLLADADLTEIVKYVMSSNGLKIDDQAIAAAVASAASASKAPTTNSPATVDAGQALFAKNCNMCHPDGNGGMGPSLRTSAFKSSYSTEGKITEPVRAGKGAMPAFAANRLADQELSELSKYVLGLAEEAK